MGSNIVIWYHHIVLPFFFSEVIMDEIYPTEGLDIDDEDELPVMPESALPDTTAKRDEAFQLGEPLTNLDGPSSSKEGARRLVEVRRGLSKVRQRFSLSLSIYIYYK